MTHDQEPLQYLPLERWSELQNAFKTDWPRGISGYAALEIQKQWADQAIDYEVKVYCPFGDVGEGMVAINFKENFYEIIIQCPKNDISKLRDALIKTKIIDWNRNVIVPYVSSNVVECLKNIVQEINMDLEVHRFLNTYILEQEFDDVSLPANLTFGQVTLEYLDLVDKTWPNRYPNSMWHFELLIKAKQGWGLYLNNALISWVFMKEVGPLQHWYTVEEHRKKGYGELVLKLASNIWLKENKPVFAFCFKDNVNACKLYRKLGFREGEPVCWCYLNVKET